MNSTYNTAYLQGFFQAYGRDKEAQTAVPPEHAIKNPGSDAAGSFGGSSTSAPVPPPEIPLRDRQQNWDDMHNAARTEAAAGVNPREAQRYIKNLPKRRPTSTDLNWESPIVRTAADWFAPEDGKFISQELRPTEGWREKAVANIYEATKPEDRGWFRKKLFEAYRKDLYATSPAFRDEVHTILEPGLKRWGKDFARKAAPYAAVAATLAGGAALMMGGRNKSPAGVPASPSPSYRDPRIDVLKELFTKKNRPGVSPDRPRVTGTWDPMNPSRYRGRDG
jgi:hypothetical protein